MRCTSCGTQLLAGKQFCHNCGTRVALACAGCGAAVLPEFRFCPDCGRPTGAPEKPPAADPLARVTTRLPEGLAQRIRETQGLIGGERKLVTVLFCDLVGSTAIAARLDAEEYRELLDRYIESAFREIHRFDGVVNHIAGDGMMAMFGAPIAHEDAPQRAVSAALAIRDAIGELNETVLRDGTLELRARIGIHTGPVVVGTIGNDLRMDYTAVGDTTNLGARLEGLAPPGSIVMSESTERIVRGFFEVRRVGPFAVKGKSEPVFAYEVLAARETPTAISIAAERGLTPLVGRGEELAQLEACYERSASGLAQVVAVIGEAGSGRSRLLYEFRQRLGASGAVFLEGRCAALNQMVAYYPFVCMMRQYFGIGSADTSQSTCEKIGRVLERWPEHREQMFPFLCRFLTAAAAGKVDVPPEEHKRGTFEAISKLVMLETESAPVVMVVEDLHWVDEPSREMLEMAVSRLDRARFMLAVTCRPDFPVAWRTAAAFTQISLRPLSTADAGQIVHALAGGPLPAELEQLILTKAEGSPFFTEEITRSLIEEGFITPSGGRPQVTRPVHEIRIPGNVEEVIAARLDRLRGNAKRVAQVAAVLGRQFRRGQLARLLAEESIDVDQELVELENRGIIHRKTIFSDDEYRFGESLTQQVAYESLLNRQRRQLHERIGQLLETSEEDSSERSALLAHHFSRSDNRLKAIHWLLRAAADAERVPSYPAASDFYRQAWELAERSLENAAASEDARRTAMAAALGVCRMNVLYGSSEDTQGVEIARRGRALATDGSDASARASFYTFEGMMTLAGPREHFAGGVALIEQGLRVAEQAGLQLVALSVARGLGFAYLYDGRFDLVQSIFRRVLAELEALGEHERLSDLYLGTRYLGEWARLLCDDFDAALRGSVESYELAVRASNRTVQSGLAASLGWAHLLRGEYAAARSWADRGLAVAEVIGSVAAIRTNAMIALAVRAETGEPLNLARYLSEIEQSYTMRGDMGLKAHIVVDTLISIGENRRARRFAEIAYAHGGGRLREAACSIALGAVRARSGCGREAERLYEDAIRLATEIGSRSLLVMAKVELARLRAQRGDRAACLVHAGEARELAGALGLERYRLRAERLLEDNAAADEAKLAREA